jgi:hypothetical protein
MLPGVFINEVIAAVQEFLQPELIINTIEVMKTENEISAMVQKYVTDDPVFGYISPLELEEYFDPSKITALHQKLNEIHGCKVIIGPGAT